MPAEESKPVDPAVAQADATIKAKAAEIESDVSDSEHDDAGAADAHAAAEAGPSEAAAKKKKKKSKRKKAKELLSGKPASPQDEMSKAIANLQPHQLKEILALNPALAHEVAAASGTTNPSAEQTAEMLKKLNLQELMTGLAAGGKNAKDMASYKFWQTQPVPRFDDKDDQMAEGPLKVQTVDEVSREPAALVPGFEWVTVDLGSDEEVKEVYELLNGHYVEDDDAQFRFNYSPSLLRWAMMSPGWQKRYHIGVRAAQSRKLVAFISAIPVHLRVRQNTVLCSEVNFLCVHKKLRGKRLAPVLIKEVTRISNLDQVWQGLYTAGVVLPRPVSTCRYYHRSLNWQKLYECGFSPLPPNSKPQYQVRKYALPDETSTKGLREMKEGDVDEVLALLRRYLARFDMAPEFTREEAVHWFLPKIESGGEQVVWSYVVEDADKKITDFFSFYSVESSVINNPKHSVVRVAYLFYYATTEGLDPSAASPSSSSAASPANSAPYNPPALKTRLNALMNDALILAKRAKFDVFNALTLMDNALFLEQQKFGAGDGQLHYYLFNYRANSIRGGVTREMKLDDKGLSGIGLIML